MKQELGGTWTEQSLRNNVEKKSGNGRKHIWNVCIYVLFSGHGMDREGWLKGIKSKQIAMAM